jgi:hypothetical protein
MVIKDSGRIDSPVAVDFSFTVGIHEDDAAQQHPADNGGRPITMGAIGEIHEFGAGAVPARSWLRGWFDENEAPVRAMLAEALASLAVKQRWSTPGPLREAARKVRNSVVQRIAKHVAPPLAVSTLAKKAPKIVPLIDSRAFVDSISTQIQSTPGQADSRGKRIGWDYAARAGGAKK